MELQQGQVIRGRYKIVEPIGQGGMSSIYQAIDMASQEQTSVAIKVFDPIPSSVASEFTHHRKPTEPMLQASQEQLGDKQTSVNSSNNPLIPNGDTLDEIDDKVGSTKASIGNFADFYSVYEEAMTLQELHHPNIPHVIDSFEEGNNYLLVMELIEGDNIATSLEETENGLDERQVLMWFDQVIDAVIYCHNRGIIHRDIKPSNIIVNIS